MDFKFDRSKLFYPYVINYIISVHGLIELISRDFYSRIGNVIKNGEDINKFIKEIGDGDPKNAKYLQDIADSNLKPTVLIGEINLRSESKPKRIDISVDEIAKEIVDNHIYLIPFQLKAAGILLIMSYEISKDQYDAKDELWNFFYHCRNAAAHGGKFNITNFKRFPAKWDNLEITTTMNGSNLFKDNNNNGLLSIGDPLYFLHDIETKYII